MCMYLAYVFPSVTHEGSLWEESNAYSFVRPITNLPFVLHNSTFSLLKPDRYFVMRQICFEQRHDGCRTYEAA